jgi:hypothetical protein
MADCEGPECEFDTDKPLLPKWLAWTWPTNWYWWIFWGFGALLAGFGLGLSLIIAFTEGDMTAQILAAAVGTFIMGWCSPNPFAQMMKGFTFGADPERWSSAPLPPMGESGWHLNRGYWDEKNEEWVPNGLAPFEQDNPNVNISKLDDEWVVGCQGEDTETFSTQKEASDYMAKKIRDAERIDSQELLFGDHPRHNRFRALFNATPPQFTARFIFHTFSVMFTVGIYLATPLESREALGLMPIALMVLGAISIIISHFWYRGSVEAWDTVTSIIKYVDGGHGELVGQVRPLNSIPQPILHLDGCTAPSWTFDDLVAWTWAYTCTETWTERYYDSQSKTWKTRTRRETRTVRDGRYATDFMVHDGTGGMAVKLTTFERVSLGGAIWERKRRGDNTCGPYDHSRHGGSLKHNWTLYALRKGDPTYIMARIKSRNHDDIPSGNVGFNATRVHHTLEAVGEDAPRRRAKISKGNEFTMLTAKNSSTSRLGPWLLLIAGSMALMFL